MKKTEIKKLRKFIERKEKEKEILGTHYKDYQSFKLTKETAGLKKATWTMGIGTLFLAFVALYDSSNKEEMINVVSSIFYFSVGVFFILVALGILLQITNFIKKRFKK